MTILQPGEIIIGKRFVEGLEKARREIAEKMMAERMELYARQLIYADRPPNIIIQLHDSPQERSSEEPVTITTESVTFSIDPVALRLGEPKPSYKRIVKKRKEGD